MKNMNLMQDKRTLTHEEWLAEGTRLFGSDKAMWRFVCPACGCVIKAREWSELNAEGALAFSCIGSYCDRPCGDFLSNDGKQPCNYAGGGLFKLNPVTIIFDKDNKANYFDFDYSQINDK